MIFCTNTISLDDVFKFLRQSLKNEDIKFPEDVFRKYFSFFKWVETPLNLFS